MTSVIMRTKPQDLEVYSDITDYDINGSTIPRDICVVNGLGSRPDLVLVKTKHISLLELTCCFEGNEQAAYTRKMNKYTYMRNDLLEKGYIVDLVPFEIGARGHVTNSNTIKLINIFIQHKIRSNVQVMCKKVGKISPE